MVLEDGGLPVTIGLKQRDPFRTPGCAFKDPECMIDPKEDCSGQAKVYIVTCDNINCQNKVIEGPENRMGPKITEAGGNPD